MTSSADVIVQAGAGGRSLVRTADSLLRQRVPAAAIALVKSNASPEPPLVGSVASRLSAIVLAGSAYPGLTLNAAVRSGDSRYFVLLPAGYTLNETFLARCEIAFEDDTVAAVAPSVALRTPDGMGELVWTPEDVSDVAILSDTRSTPPVFAVRRESWNSVGGFDETLFGLVEYEFWLRLASARCRVEVFPQRLIARELESASGEEIDDEGRLEYFRAVLDRNRSVVDRGMKELLIKREVRFGQQRRVHRELLAQRDEDLAELDRLRAETSHHRAYLQHHGYESLEWGDLRRVSPVSREWGYDRGIPVDRRYIADFLCTHSSDVHGSVLEVQEDDFTIAYGGRRVTRHDVLDIDASNPRATVLADLRLASELVSDSFDCIILTQTLHVLDDMRDALAECHRILKPGGVLLATFPAASRVCLEYGENGDYWRVTPAGARGLLQSSFAPAEISCDVFGNVLTNTAFLHGLGAGELTDAEFNEADPYFPALTGVRAKKTSGSSRPGGRGVVLLYHRIDATPDVHELGVPPDLFEAHLQWIQSECRVMPLDDLLGTPSDRLPPRAVALTFDDGYVDNLRVAAPLLERFHAPATCFLTTGHLNNHGEYWWDTLERLMLRTSTPARLDMATAGIPLALATATDEERRTAHWHLHGFLVHASLDDRNRAMGMLREWTSDGTPRVRPLLADEVSQLARLSGITIGAHTVNHLALPDNAGTRLTEMNDCQADLRRLTGQPVDLFAYPYGAVDRETAALVRRFWRWGLSCDERMLGDSFDAARVPRLEVKAWSTAEFASRVSRLFDPPPPGRRAFTLVP
jgi:peptidoglycan/xylan/chitin deacetylase (PgdA/CDA1 family)